MDNQLTPQHIYIFGVGFRGVVGGGSPVENEGKAEGGGEGVRGWGGDRGRNRQVNAHACLKTIL